MDTNKTARVVTSVTVTVMLVLIALMLITMFSSCAPKYGCGHGHPKESWGKLMRRIN